MNTTIPTTILAVVLTASVPAVAAPSAPANGETTYVCSEAGLGKKSSIAKMVIKSVRNALKAAQIPNAKIRIARVVDIDRPRVVVPGNQTDPTVIPVEAVATPLAIAFPTETISITEPKDASCEVEREFFVRVTLPGQGGSTESSVKIKSPGRYKRSK